MKFNNKLTRRTAAGLGLVAAVSLALSACSVTGGPTLGNSEGDSTGTLH